MSLKIQPGGLATRNPNLVIPRGAHTGALKNVITLLDCQTFDGGDPTIMTDLSGNGINGQWSAAPTTSADGVHFDGVKYFDLPDNLGDENVTVYAVMKMVDNPGSTHMFGNLDHATSTGFAFLAYTGWGLQGRYNSSSNNTTVVNTEGDHPNAGLNVSVVYKCAAWRGRLIIERLDTGTITQTRRKNGQAEAQPPWANGWRFGGTRNAGALYLPTNDLRLGMAAMIDGYADGAQDVAMHQMMKTNMAARGVTVL